MDMKRTVVAAISVTLASAAFPAVVPEVSDVTISQDMARLVTVTYKLRNAPAVVTLDVQTNAAEDVWVSIGGEAVCNAKGDVWKKVGSGLSEGQTFDGTVTWRPDQSWPGHKIPEGGARAVVTAWAEDNTPDYMVVDISDAATALSQRYYPAADFVPGGVTDSLYKTTTVLMRKILAKNVGWTMGSTLLETQRTAEREATHQVMLTNNYYIGVYEVTQCQWALIQSENPEPSNFSNAADRAMRPVEMVCYNEIRTAANATSADLNHLWPAVPNPGSFLGLLRTKTGIDFDLPSEAQWEFAARAGNGDTKWGDGSGILNTGRDANLDGFGRYKFSGGYIDGTTKPEADCTATSGTAIVGSSTQNAWGIYDTAGNVWEWCLDWFEADITDYDGKVNIDMSAPRTALSGATGSSRVRRGGSWYNTADVCRPAYRYYDAANQRNYGIGFRLACTAGLR